MSGITLATVSQYGAQFQNSWCCIMIGTVRVMGIATQSFELCGGVLRFAVTLIIPTDLGQK